MFPGSSRVRCFWKPSAPSECSRRRQRELVLLVATVVVGLPAMATAQQYKSLPVNDRLRLDNIFAQNFAAGGAANPADQQRFDAFFSEYFFPAMTRPDPDHLGELSTMRQDLFGKVLWRAQSPQLQQDLTEKAFTTLLPIIKDRGYHPAVQYNAILVIGQLDAEYAIDVGANRRPPKPLPNGNKLLVAVIGAAAQGKPVAPHLVVGALVGLERHAKYHGALPPEDVANTQKAVLNLLAAKDTNQNLDRDVAAWIKLKAASVLANMGSVGQENKVHAALLSLVGNQELSLDDRCQAAALLKKLNYEGAKLDAKATAAPLVDLAVQVARSEAKSAQQFQDFYSTSGRATTGRQKRMMDRGGYSSDEGLKLDRRQLLSRLDALRAGLGAVNAVLPGDEKAQVEAVLAAIGTVIASASNKDTVDLKLAGEVQTMAQEIEAVAKPGEAAPDDAGFASEL